MKNLTVRYITYLVLVGLPYALFRISDFSSSQSTALAIVTAALGAGIIEVYYKTQKS